MIEAGLDKRRWILKTHYEVPETDKLLPAELDRVYDALTIWDGDSFSVVCPLCGWVSRPFPQTYSRIHHFSFIARILHKHLQANHSFYQRVQKSYYDYYTSDRACYRCNICGKIERGIVEILSHFIAVHGDSHDG